MKSALVVWGIAAAVGRVTGRRMPLSGDGMSIVTRWQRVEDSAAVSDLGIEWRPAEETLNDLFRWYLGSGRLPASAVPVIQAG